MKKIIDSIDEIFSENDREQILKKVKSFYENKLAEKEKEIEELKQQQLYKEDFVIYSFGCDKCNLIYSCKNKCKLFGALKDNLKYDTLSSKELIKIE